MGGMTILPEGEELMVAVIPGGEDGHPDQWTFKWPARSKQSVTEARRFAAAMIALCDYLDKIAPAGDAK